MRQGEISPLNAFVVSFDRCLRERYMSNEIGRDLSLKYVREIDMYPLKVFWGGYDQQAPYNHRSLLQNIVQVSFAKEPYPYDCKEPTNRSHQQAPYNHIELLTIFCRALLQKSPTKETCILQKRSIILRSARIIATPKREIHLSLK